MNLFSERKSEDLIKTYSDKFEEAIDKYGEKKALAQKLNAQHKQCVEEVISALELFTEETLQTEGEKVPTINYALPLVLGIIWHLQELLKTAKQTVQLIVGLLKSMYLRFNELLQLVGFMTTRAPAFVPVEGLKAGQRFNDSLYLVASLTLGLS